MLALIAALAAAGCGGGSQSFADCGNGSIDDGEQCDDGNLDDHDGCTTACRPARCGDGVAYSGVEDCDGRDLNAGTCAAMGLSGTPSCDGACRYDYSVCGAPIPPTSTPTGTFTPAPPTPTPTPTQASSCGDGLLSDDESCATCAADCTAQPCGADTASAAVTVTLGLPSGVPLSPVRLSLAYRTTTVRLPDSGLQSRFQPAQSGLIARPTDLQYAVDVQLARSGGVASGAAFTVTFDRCAGAPPPTGADFACLITNCGTTSGCTCSADVP
jgi:cysteine-rich repeat protein